MIYYKQWKTHPKDGICGYDGWFIFGIIPIYIRRLFHNGSPNKF